MRALELKKSIVPITKKPSYTEGLGIELEKLLKNNNSTASFTSMERAIMEGGHSLDVDEDWKKIAAKTVLGAAGLAAGLGSVNVGKDADRVPIVQKAAKKIMTLGKNPKLELLMRDAATSAGIAGVELAQFMAQMRLESFDFTKMNEIPSKTKFAEYEPGTPKGIRVGNKFKGDGIRYKGRGFVQLTGRYNYQQASKDLGLPLVDNPDLASKPDIAAKIAVWYWNHRVRARVSNIANTRAVTKAIQGGDSHLKEREKYFKEYLKIISPPQDSTNPALPVKKLQTDEAFTSNVPYTVVRSTNDLFTTKATIGNRVIVFNAGSNEEGPDIVWEVIFYEKRTGNMTYAKSGAGNEMKVFSFVIRSLEELAARYHPSQIRFSSHRADKNRTSLYQRMISKIAPKLGYQLSDIVSSAADDIFILDRHK